MVEGMLLKFSNKNKSLKILFLSYYISISLPIRKINDFKIRVTLHKIEVSILL